MNFSCNLRMKTVCPIGGLDNFRCASPALQVCKLCLQQNSTDPKSSFGDVVQAVVERAVFTALNLNLLLSSLLRLAADDGGLHGHGRGHHPLRLDHRPAGLLLGPGPHAVCGGASVPHGR